MDYIIGLDIGTSSVKAAAFSVEGELKNLNFKNYPILSQKLKQSVICEQNPDEIVDASLNVLKETKAFMDGLGHHLIAVGLSSVMHSIMCVDEKGDKLTNLIIWSDTRSCEYAVKSCDNMRIYRETGTPIHPMSPLYKIMWIRDNMQEIYQKAYKFISIKEYLIYRLFGIFTVDYSIASSTGMFDIKNHAWHDAALRAAGIDKSRLSEPVDTTTVLKGLSSEISQLTNIDKNTPFVIGASDGCLANLGTGAIKEGIVSVTIGTSGAVRMAISKPETDADMRTFTYILSKDIYITGGPINNGGLALKWFGDNFVHMANKELDKIASSVNPGSDGLIFLPYLTGERAPYWDSGLKAAFTGITINHHTEHFARAIMEGVIYCVKNILNDLSDIMSARDMQITDLIASGGFCYSDIWVQILSDVTGRVIKTAISPQSTALGASILASYATGCIKSLDKACEIVKMGKEYKPDEQAHAIYRKLFADFIRMNNAIR